MWVYNFADDLYHHGILGMKWGTRRYQNSDGSLTEKGRRLLEKKDLKWAKKNTDKITNKAKRASIKELNSLANQLLQLSNARKTNGKLSSQIINVYNKRMAELMSQKTSEIRAPSGRVVSFVAKRGEVGVFMALSNSGYDPNQFKNGVYGSGRIAYRKTVVDKVDI